MPKSRLGACCTLIVSLIAICLVGCEGERTAQLVEDIGLGEFSDSTLDLPTMYYANGQTTINDRCPVRKVRLNRRLTPLFVNGRPLGFC